MENILQKLVLRIISIGSGIEEYLKNWDHEHCIKHQNQERTWRTFYKQIMMDHKVYIIKHQTRKEHGEHFTNRL